jgi:hypothetical protein
MLEYSYLPKQTQSALLRGYPRPFEVVEKLPSQVLKLSTRDSTRNVQSYVTTATETSLTSDEFLQVSLISNSCLLKRFHVQQNTLLFY